MSSGIKVLEEIKDTYQELKDSHMYSYIIFKIRDNKEVIVDRKGAKDETFEDFRGQLLKAAKEDKEARYAFYDFIDEKTKDSKNPTGKLMFILWSSDNDLPVKQKMVYTSSLNAVKSACTGFAKFCQINDEDDLTEDHLKKELNMTK